jgi:uncharacterized repeat protein (TIGR02543 family)
MRASKALQRGSRLLLLALATPFLLIATPLSTATAAATQQSITVYGGNGTPGTVDTATEVSIDGGVTWGQAYFAGTHPWGLVAGTSTWINCGPSLNNCLNQVSWYRYRFFLASDNETTTLTAAIKVDNYASMYINGAHLQVGGVNLNVNGGSGGTWGGSPPDWSTTDLPIQSYIHSGWNDISVELTDVGGLAGINYAFTIKTFSNSPITLSSPGQIYTITYDAQGGTVSRASDTATAGGTISAFPTPTRSGYSFDGWFTAASGGSLITAPFTPTSDQTIYAHWTATYVAPPVVYHMLTLNAQGGTAAYYGINAVHGAVISALPLPVRAGYTFNGWFDRAANGNVVTTPLVINSSSTIYAQWSRIYCTVSYATNGESSVTDDLVGQGETLTALPTLIRAGYSFDGWFDAQGAGNRISAPVIINSSRTLFARWIANTYTVTVQTSNGPQSQPVVQGGTFTAPPAPSVAPGYNFLGWSRTQNSQMIDFKANEVVSSISVTDNFQLYPVTEVQSQFKPGSLNSTIYFGMDEYFLDAGDRKLLNQLKSSVDAHLLKGSTVKVEITGWVQPTSINPRIQWLSKQRALAVKLFLAKLGLIADFSVSAPGLAQESGAKARKSTIVISWSPAAGN